MSKSHSEGFIDIFTGNIIYNFYYVVLFVLDKPLVIIFFPNIYLFNYVHI